MELTKIDTQKAQGVAALGMVMLHLFCRLEDLPYTPLIWFGDVPLIYYLGLFGDCCVPIAERRKESEMMYRPKEVIITTSDGAREISVVINNISSV